METALPERHSFAQAIADAWKSFWRRQFRLAEFDAADPSEMRRLAGDIGISVKDLRTLAGGDKSVAGLLRRRLVALGLRPDAVDSTVMRDLELHCCVDCESRRRCAHDLDTRPRDEAWQDYCPNCETLCALLAEKCH